MDRLNDAQVLLLAAQLAALPDLDTLRGLAATRRDVLSSSIVYRTLLTYLPLDTDPDVESQLLSLLQDLDQDFANFNPLDTQIDQDHLDVPSAADAEQSLAELQLEKVPVYDPARPEDALSDFVIAWIRKLESLAGIPGSAMHLAAQLLANHPVLQRWVDSFLRPLHRLQNEYYVDRASTLSLQDLETNHGEAGVAALLESAAQSTEPANVSRDLENVVSPWIRGATGSKRRKLTHPADTHQVVQTTAWKDVDAWLLSTAQKNYDLAVSAVEQWNGPSSGDASEDIDDEERIAYIQTVLALVYCSTDNDDSARLAAKKSLLQRATSLAQLMPPDFGVLLPDIPDISGIRRASRSDLMLNTLLAPQNQLTRPSTDLVDFLYGVLSTQALLERFKIESATRSVVSTVLFESEEKQKQELRTILAQIPRLPRANLKWSELRQQLQWLRTWSHHAVVQDGPAAAYLGRLSHEYVELQVLDAMLAANDYRDVRAIYLEAQEPPLSVEEVQRLVFNAVLSAYDNASNGNRTRGGVKRASEIIQAFRSLLPDNETLTQLDHLIKATHSLSFYQLTLQHGVPFQPVSIRVASDPLSLIEKLLDQNNKAYAKLDDLLGIARNLVLAGLATPHSSDYAPGEEVPLERRLFDAEHRITYSAIIAALTDHDFDTAYSLITTRLGAPQNKGDEFVDDTTWRAAYAAGRHRPASSPQDIHKQISSLQKRMELLSKALTLAPTAEPLPEILATWRRCEEELDSLKSQALQEERALEAQSDTLLPGGFGPGDHDLDANETRRMLEARRAYNATAPSYEDEAPMGLFEVARGAASALRKNAFPLRGAGQQRGAGFKVRDQPRQSMDSSGELERPGSSDGQRVRKRDMISNAVAGTVVSGLGWVLGAQPTNRQPSQGQ